MCLQPRASAVGGDEGHIQLVTSKHLPCGFTQCFWHLTCSTAHPYLTSNSWFNVHIHIVLCRLCTGRTASHMGMKRECVVSRSAVSRSAAQLVPAAISSLLQSQGSEVCRRASLAQSSRQISLVSQLNVDAVLCMLC